MPAPWSPHRPKPFAQFTDTDWLHYARFAAATLRADAAAPDARHSPDVVRSWLTAADKYDRTAERLEERLRPPAPVVQIRATPPDHRKESTMSNLGPLYASLKNAEGQLESGRRSASRSLALFQARLVFRAARAVLVQLQQIVWRLGSGVTTYTVDDQPVPEGHEIKSSLRDVYLHIKAAADQLEVAKDINEAAIAAAKKRADQAAEQAQAS